MRATLALMTLIAMVAPSPAAAAEEGRPVSPGKAEFLSCGRLLATQPLVRLPQVPEVRIGDLIAFVSSISCRRIVVAPGLPVDRVVSLHAPRLLTPVQTYDLLLAGLEVAGLTVQPSRDLLRVVPAPPAR